MIPASMKTKSFAGVGPHGFTTRALVIGVILSVFLNLACPYTVLVMHAAGLTSDYITAGAMMLLFVLVLLVNPVLKLLFGHRALSSAELLLIYIMMIVASAIPTWGLVTNMFHILTRPFYYATPENAWAEIILPHVPSWITPDNPQIAINFYLGLPAGEATPWRPWIMPLFWWTTFMVAVYFLMICMMVMVRRQWVEHERLTFPLVHPPLEIIRGNDEHIVPPLFRTWKFWIPFIIVFLLVSQKPLRFRYPEWPQVLVFDQWFRFFRNTVAINFFWNFAIVGVTYFINLDVAASLWIFALLAKIETGVFNLVGFRLAGRNPILTGSSAATSHQNMGAVIVLTVVVLWRARHHLRDVFRKAFLGAADIDDSDEIMSYRTAVVGTIVGGLFILGWLTACGMSLLVAVVFIVAAYVLFFAITRVVAVGGIGFCAGPMLPQPFTAYALGPALVGPRDLTAMAFQYSWAAEYRTSVMTSSINGMKLSHDCGTGQRRVFLGMMLAMVAGMAGAVWVTMHLNYTRGGANMRIFGVPWIAFNFLEYHLKNPITNQIIWERWAFTGIGAAVMWALVFLRHTFPWWPLHYVGFVVGDSWVMGRAWWSVFLGWLAKLIVMRMGGAEAYRRYMPIFLGMLFGQLMCGGFWMVWDFFNDVVKDYVYIGVP